MVIASSDKLPPDAWDDEDHARAAGVLYVLFDRAEQAARNELRARKKGETTGMPEDGARRVLANLRSFRAGVRKSTPTWKYVFDVIVLAEALPPPRTERRHKRERQRAAAKSPRPNKLNTLLRSIKREHPEYSWKHVEKALQQEVGKGIVERIDPDDAKPRYIWWKDSKKKPLRQADMGALPSRLSKLK